ncbi:ZirU family protein [Pseudomonas arsenicoxydans]|uniref:Uncharacterized protein n=1 Tax=Pseudomonas arsenicoxydans TaxID=702115 RepID=A0A502GWF4_9PSED|nr:ZirU family protein [Pseudomonas arsenicoxydans]TPG65718.1 hypothetical protein EAH78_31540 [Pseudomonas arsenicoxydans]
MKTFNVKKTRLHAQAFGVVLGVVASASVMAAVTTQTATVKGRMPVTSYAHIISTDNNGNGIVDTGDHLEVNSVGMDPDGDTMYFKAGAARWHDGTNNLAISGPEPYVIKASDLGKAITVYYTPNTNADITDPSEGLEKQSAAIQVAPGNTFLSLSVTGLDAGYPKVNQNVKVVPVCLTGCGTITYKWERETAFGTGVYSVIAGQTTDTYRPAKEDQRRRLKITANN